MHGSLLNSFDHFSAYDLLTLHMPVLVIGAAYPVTTTTILLSERRSAGMYCSVVSAYKCVCCCA